MCLFFFIKLYIISAKGVKSPYAGGIGWPAILRSASKKAVGPP